MVSVMFSLRSCYVKAHSLSTGWISICCQCCSTKQWDAVFHMSLWKCSLSQKASDGVPSCHCSELSNVWGFPHVVTGLFQTSVDAVFLVLSMDIYEAVDGSPYVVTVVSLSSECDFLYFVTDDRVFPTRWMGEVPSFQLNICSFPSPT